MKTGLKLFYICVLAALVLLARAFSSTDGFVYGCDQVGNFLYTKDLMSSGSNDNLSIECGQFLFIVPLVIRTVLWKQYPRGESILLSIIWLYQGFLLLTLEQGSILKTIFDGKNIVLLFWTISYLSLIPLFMYLIKSGNQSASVGRMTRG